MNPNVENKLAERRQALIAQIDAERLNLTHQGASLRSAADVIDKIRDGISHLKKHPELLLLPFALAVVSRPRRLLALGISGFGFWRLTQNWRRRVLS